MVPWVARSGGGRAGARRSWRRSRSWGGGEVWADGAVRLVHHAHTAHNEQHRHWDKVKFGCSLSGKIIRFTLSLRSKIFHQIVSKYISAVSWGWAEGCSDGREREDRAGSHDLPASHWLPVATWPRPGLSLVERGRCRAERRRRQERRAVGDDAVFIDLKDFVFKQKNILEHRHPLPATFEEI